MEKGSGAAWSVRDARAGWGVGRPKRRWLVPEEEADGVLNYLERCLALGVPPTYEAVYLSVAAATLLGQLAAEALHLRAARGGVVRRDRRGG